MIINDSININESKQVVLSEVKKYIDKKDVKGLTQYLKSMPDDTICTNPYNANEYFHKADNGVKSGWGWYINKDRKNIFLFKDDEVAKSLIGI